MEVARSRAIAERLHAAAVDESGAPVLAHVARVAGLAPPEARAVAWLHEALDATDVTEQELLQSGLSSDQLRALRLLRRTPDIRSTRIYLAYIDRIARAAGHSGVLARMVKTADLEDRCRHPRVRPDGWSPPYALGLELLGAAEGRDEVAMIG
jgi:hypothetical protein